MTAMGITSFAGLPSKMALLREDAATAAEAKDAVPGGGRPRSRKAPPPRPTPHHHHHPHQPPPLAVARRNARERNRVKQVNNGFATLRQHIPAAVAEAYAASTAAASGEAASAASTPQGRGKKLSKVETLRLAVDYIRSLQRLLSDEAGAAAGGSPVPSAAGGAGGFAFADDDDDGRSGTGASLDDDLASADGSGSPFSLAADDGRYLQQLYAPPQVQFAPPSVVVKQERLDEEPSPGAVDRAVLEMMWWEQARRLRIISAAPPPPSPS